MSINTSPGQIRREAALKLKGLRLRARVHQKTACAAIGKPGHYRISYLERAEGWPDTDELDILLTLYRATPEEATEIRTMIRVGRDLSEAWYETPEMRKLFGKTDQFFAVEFNAKNIFSHSGTIVPGLSQTEEYATKLVEFSQASRSSRDRDLWVEARMRRKAILNRPSPPVIHQLMHQAALRTEVGGRRIMRDQLAALFSHASRSNVTVQIIPYDAGVAAAHGTPFSIYERPGEDSPTVAVFEKLRGHDVTASPEDVRWARDFFSNVLRSALSRQDSIDLIEGALKAL